MKRAVLAAAILLFAVVSAPRLRFDHLPRAVLPELRVDLALGDEASDRWIVPIESTIRSLGDVTATRAELSVSGARFTVRFRNGIDANVKAARLSSELASLRAKLPRDGRISVWPSTQAGDRASLIVAMTDGEARAKRVAEEVRAARGVRAVELFGIEQPIVDVRLRRDADTEAVRAAIEAALAPRPLGKTVVVAPSSRRIEDLRLGAIAEVRLRIAEAESVARVNGKPAILMAIRRDDDASLFAFESSVRDRLRGLRVEELYNEAAELRAMLLRAAIAALVASLILALCGWELAFWIPLSTALAINVFRVAGLTVDATVVVMAMIAFAGLAPFAATRRPRLLIAALFVALVPLAVAFASGALAPVALPAARGFFVCAVCAVVCRWLGERASRPPTGGGRDARSPMTALRNAASVALAAATIACALFTIFGERLDPRAESVAEPGRMYLRLSLAEGTTLAQSIATTARVETQLRGLDGIRRTWSFVWPGGATISLELAPELRDPVKSERFQLALRSRVPLPPGVFAIGGSMDARASRMSDELEDEPAADEDGAMYRFLLQGSDAGELWRISDSIATRITRYDVRRSLIRPEWPAPSVAITLVPRPETTAAEAIAAAATLRERSTPAREWRLPDGRTVRLAAFGAPRMGENAPQRADLFARPIGSRALLDVFDVRNTYVSGGATRASGRFVLPVTVVIPGFDRETRLKKRTEIDRALAAMALPGGVDLARPSLSEWTFSARKLRLYGLAALFPTLLFAAAAIVLSSLRAAFVAVSASAAGVAFAAPALLATASPLDAIALLAIAAATSCATAFAVRAHRERATEAYRLLRHDAAPALIATFAVAAMLVILATVPAAARDGWRGPLAAAAAVLGAGVPASLFVAPALNVVWSNVRRRRTPAARAEAHPIAWRGGDPPDLVVRNVAKRYERGFLALREISFTLTPGVIGLLGPNGAGKTTLLRILTGLLMPTRGQVLHRGVAIGPQNLAEYRRLIGFLPQEFNAYAALSAIDFLEYWALERGITNAAARRALVERLLATVGLERDGARRVRDFSGGMRQRIGIARALIGDPPLLVVDEPTTGLDLESRHRFRDLIVSLAKDRIILLSTHIAGDVEATASRILLLARGRLQWDGTPAALIARAEGRVFDAVVSDAEARALSHRFRLTTRLRTLDGVRVRGVAPPGVELPGPPTTPTLEEAYIAEVRTAPADWRDLRAGVL